MRPGGLAWLAVSILAVGSSAGLLAAPKKAKPAVEPPGAQTLKMTPEEARRSAAMLDDAYQEFLQTIHAWYPTKTGQPKVAASTVIELQKIMAEKGWPQSKFLAVNAIVMNPNHLPEDKFDKDAIAAIKSGKDRYEKVVDGRLRIATVVPTGGGCFSCHWTDSKVGSRAALSFSIPLSTRTGSR